MLVIGMVAADLAAAGCAVDAGLTLSLNSFESADSFNVAVPLVVKQFFIYINVTKQVIVKLALEFFL